MVKQIMSSETSPLQKARLNFEMLSSVFVAIF